MTAKMPPNLKLAPARLAIFLDVDGTLAPITERPEQSRIPWMTRRTLAHMQQSGVALAALSGRPLSQVRRLLRPLCMPAAGSHGAQLRFGSTGVVCARPKIPYTLNQALVDGLAPLQGVWLERKPAAFAVHWRQAPHYEPAVEQVVHDALLRAPGWSLVRGHCVHELRAPGSDKGKALSRLMRRPEFAGRWPLAIGDDTTDEDAFRAAIGMGGAAIRVGPSLQTIAPWQVEDVTMLAAWLKLQLRTLRQRSD